MHVNTINSAPGNSPWGFDGILSHWAVREWVLTCDKLGSLLEVGKYEVGHYVEACKQEYTDLQERQKNLRVKKKEI